MPTEPISEIPLQAQLYQLAFTAYQTTTEFSSLQHRLFI